MAAADNKALASEYFEAFGRNDFPALQRVVHPDVLYHTAPPGLSPGIEGYRELMAMYKSAFPDLEVTVGDMVAEDDKVAARFSSTGTHRGELMGIAPTGKRVTVGGMSILRIANGKITDEWDQIDMLGLMQQLGAIPEPAPA
jgi:steroid delta-isomerase-like uncharacterized protein